MPMHAPVLSGLRFQRAVIAGALWVIRMQENLNQINVYPVADSDTGTNMASTLRSVAEGAMSYEGDSVAEVSQVLADSALMGARGNSGAIIAQFFQGLAEGFRGRDQASLQDFSQAAQSASTMAYEAMAKPQEGTILTVIREWAHHLHEHAHVDREFMEVFTSSLSAAKESLAHTPEKLKVLAKAGVVDAGGQGFVHLLEGMHHFFEKGRVDYDEGLGAQLKASTMNIEKATEEIIFQFCTECFIEGEDIDRNELRTQLAEMGDSLIVAGSSSKVKIHVHTNEPKQVFEMVSEFGTIQSRKVDDMRAQHESFFEDAQAETIGLVTDSSCDLPQEFFRIHNVHTVPLQLIVGDTTYRDKVDVTPTVLYRMIEDDDVQPKTSQPPPADFKEVFESALKLHRSLISVNLSGALSGTLQAAQMAAKLLPEGKVRIVDSKSASVGLGLVLQEAAKAVEEGKSEDEVVEVIEQAVERVHVFVSVPTTKYLVRGGRVPKLQGAIASLLNLRPVLGIDPEGKIVSVGKAFGGRSSWIKLMGKVNKAVAGKKNPRFAIAHANAIDAASWYYQQIKRRYDVEHIMVLDAAPVLGAHTGPGVAAVAVLTD